MSQILADIVYVFVSLFSILNPIGMSTVFLAMTNEYAPEKRHSMAWRVALYGAILLIVTFFIGRYILHFFGLSLPCIQVAGGFLVFFSAWGMLNAHPKINSEEEKEALANNDITFFPLTMPITAGAGALAVTMALGAHLATSHLSRFFDNLSVVIAIIIVFLVVGICYRYADSIFNKLGYTGTSVISRLTAFILLAIGVNIVWEGLQGLLSTLS